ncbi:hypothetical protein [Phaeovulum sp.]|uniref:hypothetical protein n=1 Tax=Phaeovulum sp. TaxID=2934796 RepID=UPI0027317533|nr:hypothetical protein [Phaeovulum sp.]MDP1669146.1 hypothetical protein [Phaeovulum sp.]MDZ4117785.1 hypothetical protein [Phaeovulum sp.]
MAEITREDLRAAVAAGHVTEAQASRLIVLADTRAGQRGAMGAEDEPFELFKGFAEIFVSVGLVILISGIVGVSALLGDPGAIMLFWAAVCWAFAFYFTRRRRMVLPSIVLVTSYAMALAGVGVWMVGKALDLESTFTGAALSVLAIIGVGLIVWYRVFRLPFTMFLLGLTGLAAVMVLTRSVNPGADLGNLADAFDLRNGSGLAMGTLIFGALAFVAGLWFDMRDPHRLGRNSASAFWLHLLAAPALVNTVALTFYNMGPGAGYWLLALALAGITVLALIIDRRSFLTAGIGYLAFLVSLVARQGGDLSWPWVLVVLGLFLTALGAFWTGLRARLMRGLPEFPGKHRLPPYAE